MPFYLFIIGFISILGQVVILRELNVAFYGIDLIYIIALGIWLLGTAAGAITGKYIFYRSPKALNIFVITSAILLPADIIFIRYTREIFGGVPGAYLQFTTQLAALSTAILPVSILLGIMFQHAAGSYVKGKNSLAKAYAWESAGGIAGGLSSTLLLYFGIQNLTSVLICGIISLLPVSYFSFIQKTRIFIYISASLTIILIAVVLNSSQIDFALTGINHPFLATAKDTPYGRISVTSYRGQVSVFENDALSFETESTASEEFVHLVLAQHSAPRSVLLLGGGIEGIIQELLKYDSLKIDYVELNKDLIGIVKPYLPNDIQSSLSNGRVNTVFDDPRAYLNKCGRYDIILTGMPEPSSGQSNRYYTKEFFELCKKHLNPGGLTAIRLKTSENLWTLPMINRNSSIYKTVKAVFSDEVVLPGSTCIITASDSVIEKNPAVLAERFAGRKIPAKYVIPEYIKYIYTNDRYYSAASMLSNGKGQINYDTRPVCYMYNTAVWLSKFFPDGSLFNKADAFQHITANKSYIFVFVIALIIILLFLRYMTSAGGVIMVFIAGFSGMMLESIIILYYQSVSGVLFQNIGLLLTSFMAGLAAGSSIINMLYRSTSNKNLFRITGFALLLFLGTLNFISGYAVNNGYFAGLGENLLLLFFAGFLVAGILRLPAFIT